MLIYDVVIIGSGIAGMTCAIYLKRAGIKTLIIEKDTPGGLLNKTFDIKNYPGFSSVNGPDLGYYLYNQAKENKVEFMYEEVKNIDFDKKLIYFNKDNVKYNYLVIATGRNAKKINSDNRNLQGISYCGLCDGTLYKGKDVALVGGGNSALSNSLYLANLCHKVIVIVRNESFRGDKEMINKVTSADNIEIIYNNEIEEIIGEDRINKIKLKSGEEITVDGLFVCIGYEPISDMFDVLTEDGYIIVNSDMETSRHDVYACGDIIKKEVYQLTTAAGEATIAANSIINKINSK